MQNAMGMCIDSCVQGDGFIQCSEGHTQPGTLMSRNDSAEKEQGGGQTYSQLPPRATLYRCPELSAFI